ncbi:MAG: hypothetical protein OZSIB_2619 [Candidatus Ozemobacter sibiricus]|uniref:Uncharacterized protein n=1 Tax=Candidatus Ozemobacter sibiricus TaxID=2268124 RepID=A0A367Z674_9BACT|nr:MAG: hypothetical protein OZSIB_2619 [Candidatus Ozemobacter sibiricus]
MFNGVARPGRIEKPPFRGRPPAHLLFRQPRIAPQPRAPSVHRRHLRFRSHAVITRPGNLRFPQAAERMEGLKPRWSKMAHRPCTHRDALCLPNEPRSAERIEGSRGLRPLAASQG